MNVPFVDLKAQYTSIKKEIDLAVGEVISSASFVGGEVVDTFENDFAKYSGSAHCVSCANGTDALEIALTVLGVGHGDEVLIPSMSWISTASAVHAVGAKPVFVDVLPLIYTMDPEDIKRKITPQSIAIIPVHLYGQMARMEEIMDIAKENDLAVVEDAAQAIGSMRNGHKAGFYGDLTTFSFYPAKNLGAFGNSGAIVTNEEVYAKSCRVMARHGQRAKNDHVALGRNSQLNTLQAAVLTVKLKYIDQWNKKRQVISRAYDKLLRDLPIQLPTIDSENKSNFHLYVIQVPNRDKVMELMKKAGVSCQIHYPVALPYMQPLKAFADGDYPVGKELGEKGLSLPMYPEMTEDQVRYVVETLRNSI